MANKNESSKTNGVTKPEAPSEKKKTGRPPKDIDRTEFEKLCSMQCTEEELCGFFGVTDKTLTAWCRRTYGQAFSDVFREKRLGGRASLRRRQWQLAESNPTLSIWLGKQYLGQSDDPRARQSSESPEEQLGKFVAALADVVKAGGR